MDLTLDRRTHGSWTVVEVGGELDLYTAPSFRESVLEAAGDHEPPKVIVDFSRLGFIDSSAWARSSPVSGTSGAGRRHVPRGSGRVRPPAASTSRAWIAS